MSLVKFSSNRFPWTNRLNDLFESDDFFKEDFFSLERSAPAINVKENNEGFEIQFAAPGFEKKDFEISVNDNMLEVSAQKNTEAIEEEDSFTRREFNYSSFKRAMQLPNTVDVSKEVKAVYKNGILKLNLLKKESLKEKPKKVVEVK